MKSFLPLGLAARLLVAVSPVSGAQALVGEQHIPVVQSSNSVASVHPWKSGNETSTRPWLAPIGHHQPRAVDVPTSPASVEQYLSEEDMKIDRIIGNVCRNC